MSRLSLIVVLVGLSLAMPFSASSQESSCLRRVLPLTATDPQGTVIEGLRATDFEANYGGGQVNILSIRPDDRPHRIVILLDASGSMAPNWRGAVALASRFAESHLPNLKTALVVFRAKVEETVDFHQGQNAVAERLRQIQPMTPKQSSTANTALYDALLFGLQLLETPTSADSLYLISDGGENASHAQVEEVTHRLTSSGVRLYVSFVVSNLHFRNRTREEVAGPEIISDLVRKTGGVINVPFGPDVPTKPEAIDLVVQKAGGPYREMFQNYRMELELPAPLKRPKGWKLNPSGAIAARLKKAAISYPTELASCKP